MPSGSKAKGLKWAEIGSNSLQCLRVWQLMEQWLYHMGAQWAVQRKMSSLRKLNWLTKYIDQFRKLKYSFQTMRVHCDKISYYKKGMSVSDGNYILYIWWCVYQRVSYLLAIKSFWLVVYCVQKTKYDSLILLA